MKMDAVRFVKEFRRMCASFGDYCTGCPLYTKAEPLDCAEIQGRFLPQAVAIVEKWAKASQGIAWQCSARAEDTYKGAGERAEQ